MKDKYNLLMWVSGHFILIVIVAVIISKYSLNKGIALSTAVISYYLMIITYYVVDIKKQLQI